MAACFQRRRDGFLTLLISFLEAFFPSVQTEAKLPIEIDEEGEPGALFNGRGLGALSGFQRRLLGRLGCR